MDWLRQQLGAHAGDGKGSQWPIFFSFALLFGFASTVLMISSRTSAFGSSLILSGACLLAGVGVGFLFGIPKSSPGGASASGARLYEANTNLESISDWLTKIIIGLGLVEIRELPPALTKVAAAWAKAVGPGYSVAFMTGLIIYFVTCGFLLGYLWTRLTLIGDFIANDPRGLVKEALGEVERSAVKSKSTGSSDDAIVGSEVLDVARRIDSARRDGAIPLSELRSEIDRLASDYTVTRSMLGSSDERTRQMETIAAQMRALSMGAYSLLPDLMEAESAGKRLAAVMFLQMHPNLTAVDWLSERFAAEKPFIGYQAALALKRAAAEFAGNADVAEAIERSKKALDDAGVPRDAQRFQILESAAERVWQTAAED